MDEMYQHPDSLHAALRPPVPMFESPVVYGAYLREPAFHSTPFARFLLLLAGTGLGILLWIYLGDIGVGSADELWSSAALAGWFAVVGGGYYAITRPGPELGIALSDTTVRFGRWLDDVHEIHLDDLDSVHLSETPWTGEQLAPALRSYLVRGFRWLTLVRKDGVTYHVAIDSGNRYADRISDALTGRSELAPPRPPSELSALEDPDLVEQADGNNFGAQQAAESMAHRPQEPEPPDPSPADAGTSPGEPPSERLLWAAAIKRHDQVLVAYLPYEIDPHLLMRYPALTDVTVEATAEFLDALGDAGALRTDAFPSDGLSAHYRERVRLLAVAWSRAEKHAKKVGTSLLEPAQQRKLGQAAKLLRHAEGASTPAEQATYLRQVAAIVDELVQQGAITAPPKIVAEIAARTRLAIERAGNTERAGSIERAGATGQTESGGRHGWQDETDGLGT